MSAPPERSRKMMPVPKDVLDHLDRHSWPDPGTRTGRAARWRVLERVLTEYERLQLKEYGDGLEAEDRRAIRGGYYDR